MSKKSQRGQKFHRRMKSSSFGSWLRKARIDLGINQQSAAAQCKDFNHQQHWSKMECHGWVPLDEFLPQICQAVRRSVSEAKEAIARGDKIESGGSYSYLSYKQSLIRFGQSADRVGIFVIREDPQPVDLVQAQEFLDILATTKNTLLTILFRYPDPRTWHSFYQLVHSIAALATDDQQTCLKRLRAFHRHPECAENVDRSLPLIHPYLLACSRHELSLSSGIVDETLRQKELTAGFGETVARHRSLEIISHDQQAASDIASWIGLQNESDPLSNLWHPITAT